jgi:hypothetical protein
MPRSPELPSPVCHRALLFVLVALTVSVASAQSDKYNQPTDRAAPGRANQAEGARILAEFRPNAVPAGEYWLAFELRVMPRKGPERSVTGAMIGMKGETGPISRLSVGGQNWLIQSGPQPAAWTIPPGDTAKAVATDASQAVAGSDLTLFELQMSFLFWTDFTYEGEARVRGRPTHSFVLRPPAGYTMPRPGFSGVRVFIDAQFQAMVQAEELGAKGEVEKSIVLLDLKKVGEQWLVKAIDVRDLRTRGKTRLTLTAAATNLALPAGTFRPENLSAPFPEVPSANIVRF